MTGIQAAKMEVEKLWTKHGIQEPIQFLGFCLSLLPLPVIQQAGQAIDRHYSDIAFQKELTAIWSAINSANNAVSKVGTLEESIKAIAAVLDNDKTLLEQSRQFTQNLVGVEAFNMVTERGSYQELVHSIVQADMALISAKQNSTNVIEHSTIKATSTHLHASDNSRNFVHGTTFGKDSSVRMDGITTKGDIRVGPSSVGLGAGGALIFGGNPNLVSGNCPLCGFKVELDRRQLTGHTSIQCPNCKAVLPFNLNL